MKQINWKSVVGTSLLTLFPLGLGLIYWQELPAQLATHLHYSGEVNGLIPKTWYVLVLPLILTACNLFLVLLFDWKQMRHQVVIQKLKWAFAGLMGLVPTMFIAYNLGWLTDIRKLVIAVIALAWLFIGNYGSKEGRMRIVKQTRASRKMRRLTSLLFVGSALLLLASLVFPVTISFWLLWLITGGMVLWSLFSSFYVMRQEKSEA